MSTTYTAWTIIRVHLQRTKIDCEFGIYNFLGVR